MHMFNQTILFTKNHRQTTKIVIGRLFKIDTKTGFSQRLIYFCLWYTMYVCNKNALRNTKFYLHNQKLQ